MHPTRKLLYVSVLAVFSLGPYEVSAQPVPVFYPVFTGKVKCEGINLESGAKYNKEFSPVSVSFSPSGDPTVEGRWGSSPGGDVTYFAKGRQVGPGTVTYGFVNIDGGEGSYSETGSMKLSTESKSDKSKSSTTKLKLKGESMVFSDDPSNVVGASISAECEWDLTAPLPPAPI